MEAKFEYLFFDIHEKSFYYEYHKHPCYELVYYISGKGFSNIDSINSSFEKNTFSFMPADSLHNRSYIEDTEFVAIGFLFNLPIEIKGGVYQDDDGKILSYMQEIKQEFLNKKNHFQLRLNVLIVEILIQIDRLINTSKKQDEFNSFIYLKNYVDVHYNEKINFCKLAELSFYSYDHFRHKFKEFTGCSPNHYLMLRRIENAKEKLIRTDKNIIEVAMECGFSTSAQFCHLFKKYTSQTPLEYRKKYKTPLDNKN